MQQALQLLLARQGLPAVAAVTTSAPAAASSAIIANGWCSPHHHPTPCGCRQCSGGGASSSGSSSSRTTRSSAAGWGLATAAGFHSSTAASAAAAAAGKSKKAAAAPPAAAPEGDSAAGAAGGGGGAPAGEQWSQLAHLRGNYRRSRMLDFYQRFLARELMLKLNVRSVNELPRLERAHLSVQAKRALGTPIAEKWQLLLHALALEVATGAPARFARPSDRYYRRRNVVTGVSVALSGAAAHDALEKAVHLLLPAQPAFAGVLTRQLDRAGHLHARAANAAGLPDFEEMYETFEGVGGVDVGFVLRNAAPKKPGRSRLLLTGLQVPVVAQRYRAGGAGGAGGSAGSAAGGGGSEAAGGADAAAGGGGGAE